MGAPRILLTLAGYKPVALETGTPVASPGVEVEETATAGGEISVAPEIRSDKQRLSPRVSAGDSDDLVAGNTAFAFDRYQALRGGDGNLLYSPYSISLALAMTYGGARGDTEAQMADVLPFTLPQEQLHPAFNALDTTLLGQSEGDDGLLLRIANAIRG